ncbi:hypothetical protein HW555_003227 [Spodoptera exigua]|uniref:Uncharacterized protein n=1 Tax=Spodoptera exigua TaxID=7107 RepID=A0A835GKQ3_SPOEX|nr:hypothetical protein HW555_003227 [Spodoptera exigua]
MNTHGYKRVVVESLGHGYNGPGGIYSEFVYVNKVASVKNIFVTIFVDTYVQETSSAYNL